MSKEEIIKNIIQEVLNVDLIQITNSAHLIHDLGASEFQLYEIVRTIEDRFSIVLGFESFDMTVEDLLIVAFSEMQIEKENMRLKPRPLHYAFVYQLLPGLAFNEGVNIFGDLRFKKGYDYMHDSSAIVRMDTQARSVTNGLDYLYDMWNSLSKDLKDYEIYPKGLDYEIVEKSGQLILVFRFPQPKAIGEAFYSLFILSLDESETNASRYFTFELSRDNQKNIGEWTEKGEHLVYETYQLELTPRQFLEEVFKHHMPRQNKSFLDEKTDSSVNPQFLVEGLFEKEHIYLKIISALANKLNMPVDLINKNTPVQDITKQDCIDIICDVYKMYGIDIQKHLFFIRQDVDAFMKDLLVQSMNCRSLVVKICRHFEHRIAGDYDNPKELYLDYRKKIDLISQSTEFQILYNFISQTYPSFITDNADPIKIGNKTLLYREILKIRDIHLAHNYPIDPRGLFICLTAMAITHANFTNDEEKMMKYLDAANLLNTKWGPFVKPVLMEKIANNPKNRKFKFRKLRKAMDSKLIASFYRMFHEFSRK